VSFLNPKSFLSFPTDTRNFFQIGVTANVRSKQVNAAVQAGMDGVTTKPYRIDELIAHIDRVCLDTKTFRVTNRSVAP
jgi:CheY-like chemotaxis protein